MFAARSVSSPLRQHALLDTLATRWSRLVDSLRTPYRPERHYMRGPGPKCRARPAPDGAMRAP